MKQRKLTIFVLALFLGLFAAGCKKKAPAPPPPPPPPPPPVEQPKPSPVIREFTADPSTVEKGGAVTLRWSTENANDVSIDNGVGSVPASGSRQVFPSSSTTYTLTAKGPGGEASRTARVTVTTPPPPPKPVEQPKVTWQERLANEVQDIYFDFDKSDIRPDAQQTLARDADALKDIFAAFPDAKVVIEGHCDERGSAEYNLALGDRRATATRDYLQQLGVSADRMSIISYGEERPQCFEHTEDCWQKNRRSHFAAGR